MYSSIYKGNEKTETIVEKMLSEIKNNTSVALTYFWTQEMSLLASLVDYLKKEDKEISFKSINEILSSEKDMKAAVKKGTFFTMQTQYTRKYIETEIKKQLLELKRLEEM